MTAALRDFESQVAALKHRAETELAALDHEVLAPAARKAREAQAHAGRSAAQTAWAHLTTLRVAERKLGRERARLALSAELERLEGRMAEHGFTIGDLRLPKGEASRRRNDLEAQVAAARQAIVASLGG